MLDTSHFRFFTLNKTVCPRIFEALVFKIFKKYGNTALPKKYQIFWPQELQELGYNYSFDTIKKNFYLLKKKGLIIAQKNMLLPTEEGLAQQEELIAYFAKWISIYNTKYITYTNKRSTNEATEYKRLIWFKDEEKLLKQKKRKIKNRKHTHKVEFTKNQQYWLKVRRPDIVLSELIEATWELLPENINLPVEDLQKFIGLISSSQVLQGFMPMRKNGTEYFSLTNQYIQHAGKNLIKSLKQIRYWERKNYSVEETYTSYKIFGKDIPLYFAYAETRTFDGIAYRACTNKRKIRILIYKNLEENDIHFAQKMRDTTFIARLLYHDERFQSLVDPMHQTYPTIELSVLYRCDWIRYGLPNVILTPVHSILSLQTNGMQVKWDKAKVALSQTIKTMCKINKMTPKTLNLDSLPPRPIITRQDEEATIRALEALNEESDDMTDIDRKLALQQAFTQTSQKQIPAPKEADDVPVDSSVIQQIKSQQLDLKTKDPLMYEAIQNALASIYSETIATEKIIN